IHYMPRSENKVADTLSHVHFEPSLAVLTFHQVLDMEEIGCQVRKDVQLALIKEDILQGHNVHPNFTVEQGRLLYQGRLVVSCNFPIILIPLRDIRESPRCAKECHENSISMANMSLDS
ncbi:hypothetical protein TorRG33x02_291090, partial [Trema orientale]